MKLSNPIQMISDDVCFQTEDQRRFRLRASGIIIEDGYVLFAHNKIEPYYYSVGGAIKLGETAEEACMREVFGETGIHYEIDRLAFIHENFFKRDDGMLKGLFCHEINFYFLMKPRGIKTLKGNSMTQGISEHMAWLPIDDLDKYEAYPLFFRTKLKDVHTRGVEHIITKRL